ncbi:hypothetical protein B484DRAFT_411520 [Ochromonadaceae sp. CCMP2298]|nr:hypothetical protein B484DRAFT_411520 [Ochromonadaceae sp. CCMP2298]
MSYGLISISRFDKQGCMSIYHNRCWVVSHEGSLLCSGTLRGNLYHLDEKYRKLLFSDTDTDRESEDEHEFHLAALVKRLVSTRLGYNDIDNDWTTAPALGARERTVDQTGWIMRAFDKNPINHSVWSVLEKVGIDFEGPFPKKTPEGYIGYFLFADQASNFLKAYLVKSQRALLWCLKDFLRTIIEPTGHAWRLLQCDHAKAHKKKSVLDWLASQAIRIQFCGERHRLYYG